MNKLFYYSSLYTASSVLVKSISFLVILLGNTFHQMPMQFLGFYTQCIKRVSTFAIAGINESVIGFLKDLKTKDEKNNLYSKVLFATLPSSFLIFFIAIIFF